MRNLFSLPVYFLFVVRRDVKSVVLNMITASVAMKLISFSTFIVCLTVTVNCQKNREEGYAFSAQFQTPNSILHPSDSSIYLPPESHTAIPYYALDSMNKLPYQFLPSTASKAPSFYPTSFPIIVSSTLKSIYGDQDDDKEINEYEPIRRRLINIKPNPPNNVNNSSASRRNSDVQINSKTPNYSIAEKRFDLKPSNMQQQSNGKIFSQSTTRPASRRMIITSELQKIDSGVDQDKSPSMQNMQYIQAAPGVYVSSTTEPAIPILRLSNEMDLDGSFSYEALGADQTHYVQHSHMEHLGTDKEEQVVEGSYSYVGDDGKTYTVHYVADSNGYRASGDHLPVPPPIPEIIQRAVQYNLAEEARKPAHLKSSWENEEKEYEVGEESRHSPYHIPPPRSLFTGRTPEAFSFGFSQGPPNTVKAENLQTQMKTNSDVNADQYILKTNAKATPISPQITFLASQGAHNPSIQSPTHSTKSVSIEKPSLPQLMNYEAQLKEPEPEANKPLWRWQYGLNSNVNEPATKNSISRSSSENDDVYIHFSDLTPNQYKEIMQSQILGKNIVESNTIERSTEVQYSSPLYNDNINNNNEKEKLNGDMIENYQTYTSTERNNQFSHEDEKYQKANSNIYSELITSNNFTPQSKVATNTYNVADTSFEPTQINAIGELATKNYSSMYKNYYQNNYIKNEYNPPPEIIIKQRQPVSSSMTPLSNSEQLEKKLNEPNTFLEMKSENNMWTRETTTIETPIENIVKQNIFLRNLFKVNENENNNSKKINDNIQNSPAKLEHVIEKTPKFNPYEQSPQNEFTHPNSKPFDLSDVLNYVQMKNHFESIKTKPKAKPTNNFNYNFESRDQSLHYIPVKDNTENREIVNESGDYRVLNNDQQKEMHGIIRNYKVLQRRKNLDQKSSYLPEPQRNIKAFHTQSLPPLGRAGPSMKSYMPPTYL